MTEGIVIEIGREALLMAAMVSAPLLGMALVVGLIISILQAATQVNEATLSFIPKMVAIFLGLALFGPWMLTKLTAYTTGLLSNLATLAR